MARSRLIEKLEKGLHRKLTLISASAGFGKTTLVSEWMKQSERPSAWLSLDEGDQDPVRFLSHVIAALQTTLTSEIGEGVFRVLQNPQSPPVPVILTTLINEIMADPRPFIFVCDDVHVIQHAPSEQAIAFLLEHLPPHMHLVMVTREDPPLALLPRMRVRDELNELRAQDLRFTHEEVTRFLHDSMSLKLSMEELLQLEARTEGWIAGLQLAAISLQSSHASGEEKDTERFIQSFSGSHRFVLDYLLEEVLHKQPEAIQQFLLYTSVLDRFTGSLCEAMLGEREEGGRSGTGAGQQMLEELEQANLFLVPLDNERRWYRYHHLFAELLRQRLEQSFTVSTDKGAVSIKDLHIRASRWYEEQGLDIEAFQYAAAAHDIDRATRLMEGNGMPLPFRGAVNPVRKWLASLPVKEMNVRPSLWVMYASVLLFVGEIAGVEPKLEAAEWALADLPEDEAIRDLIGHIAAIRAALAVTRHDPDEIMFQSKRALAYLHPENIPVRTSTSWTMGYAHDLKGERVPASQAYADAVIISEQIGHFIIQMMAGMGLGHIQEVNLQLELAADTYQHVLDAAGHPPVPVACEAYLGLARIYYAWNRLEEAGSFAEQALDLAGQLDHVDRVVECERFLARLNRVQGDRANAAVHLSRAKQIARQHQFVYQLAHIAAEEVEALLETGELGAAASMVQTYDLPFSEVRLLLASGKVYEALQRLAPLRREAVDQGWPDQRLQVSILEALAYQALGDTHNALIRLTEAVNLAEPAGSVCSFADEGMSMTRLLEVAAEKRLHTASNYVLLLRDVCRENGSFTPVPVTGKDGSVSPASPPIEPLTPREQMMLQLIAEGLSNQQISERLFLALSTVKGYNRNLYGKLQVKRRTEAVARARELGLLSTFPHDHT
ncbi:LuxR C-terminal-related transcriptional regulator [Marinicrinis sediminis]|uniref:LuxR C-terminal-related transcriptional regulator n=1 Tax=Marinicrinis sediminis TaxID=1652465 RepID=A0ABW5R7V6_9BACL